MKLYVSQLRDYLRQIDNENLEAVKADKPPKNIDLMAAYCPKVKRYKVWIKVTNGAKVEILHVITARFLERQFATADAIFSFVRKELERNISVQFLSYKEL